MDDFASHRYWRGGTLLFCRKDIYVDQDGRLGSTIFGPVGDIRALGPLFAGLVHNFRQTVTVLGVFSAQKIGHHRALCMAVITDHRAGLEHDRP